MALPHRRRLSQRALSGKIDYAIADNIQAMAQSNAGRMRILAVGAGTRMQAAPDIPTLTEFGYPIDIRTWWAALVPAATPRPIVDQLNAGSARWSQSPETKTFLNGIASDPWVSKPDEGQAYFLQQIKDWADTCASPISSRRADGAWRPGGTSDGGTRVFRRGRPDAKIVLSVGSRKISTQPTAYGDVP